MTLPFYLMAHAVFGLAMGRVFEKRLLTEGEVLSPPMLWTLAPVAILTGPLGVVLTRYAGGWFFHGFFVGEGKILFERFHLGLAFLVLTSAALVSVGGMIFWAAMKSRDRLRSIKWLLGAFAIVGFALCVFEFEALFWIQGTDGSTVVSHPAGWLSVLIATILLAWEWYCKNKVVGMKVDLP